MQTAWTLRVYRDGISNLFKQATIDGTDIFESYKLMKTMQNLFITIFETSLLPNNGDQMVKKLWNQILPKMAKMMVTLLLYFKVSGPQFLFWQEITGRHKIYFQLE